jgi:magnesium transporter
VATHLQVLLESLRRLLRRNAHPRVAHILAKSRSEDIASVMRFLDEHQRQQLFELLPSDEARADMLSELDAHIFAELARGRSAEQMARVINHMSVDDQAHLLSALTDELRAELLVALQRALNPEEVRELEELLHYERDSAGGIMSTDFFALTEETTCAQAIEALQSAQDVEMAFYIYVVNAEMHLCGVVSLRELVTNPPQRTLAEIRTADVISVKLNYDQEEVAQLAARYNLLALPVVDEHNKLVGIITIDDVIDVIREEATEDILKMAGADESAFEDSSVWPNFITRAPWLFATWLGGLAASVLIGVFEHQLEKNVALAAFIPIVLGMGGNVGTQTATIMVRGLATGRVVYGLGLNYLVRELGVGALLGVFYGLLLALYAVVRYYSTGGMPLGLTVGVSVWASMVAAAVVGASTPLMFHRLKIDPAVATGPLVTTAVDVLGILVYFLVAQRVMGL